MFPPNNWKAATAANATSAAATAYSESSRPDSSFKNFLNIRSNPPSRMKGLRLHFSPGSTFSRLPGQSVHSELRSLDLAGEFVDLQADVGAQQLESGDGCQRDE